VIKDFGSKPISILGAVQRPGALNISGRWFLLQAISAAGGLTEAAGWKIYILRKKEMGFRDARSPDRGPDPRWAETWNADLPGDVVNIPNNCLGSSASARSRQPGRRVSRTISFTPLRPSKQAA
jgi:protein involved in polysaccharide export with SLBB domain